MVFELVYPHPNPLPPAGEGARRRAARSSGANQAKAERSDGPSGFHLPSGRAEKRRAWGGRGSAACRASCSDSLRLSERRERSEQSEFRSAAPRPSIAGCPEAKRRGHGQRGRLFLWLLSFWRDKKKVTAPPGAHPGQQRIQPHTVKPQTHSAPPDTAARSSGCRACPAAPSPPSTARARTDRPPHKSPCARTACPWC